MKIAVYHNLPSGGARRALYEMVRGLAARGHVLDEFCPKTADRNFLPLDEYVGRTVILPFQPRGVSPYRVPMLTPYVNALRLTTDLLTLAQVGKRAAHAIDRSDYDLVFTHDCRLVHNPDVLRFLRTPSVHYCHHGAGSRLPNPDARGPVNGLVGRAKAVYYALPRRLFPWLQERRAAQNIREAGRILTNSHFAREALFRAYGVAAQVCYLGVDTQSFHPLDLQREPFVMSVGAIGYYKGYRFLVRALGRLPAHQRPPLVIAANSSEPQERQTVQALARTAGVDLTIQRVTDDRKLLTLYSRASAFVYTPIMEPWGLAAVEAMACGTPVIAVREGGIRESVVDDQTGLLVDRDEEAFAAALVRVLADRHYAAELARRAIEHVSRTWTWEQCVDRLEQSFANVAGDIRN